MPVHPRPTRALLVGLASLGLTAALLAPVSSPAQAEPSASPDARRFNTTKVPTAVGYGGAVSSVDPEATAAGLTVLRQGGNAVDAAVATAAVLGVTEPYSAGIGGGGYFVYYDARTRRVHTIDGRETAPQSLKASDFVDSATGASLPFDWLVTSGRSVGVPGTPATWDAALRRWGNNSLAENLAPAIEVAAEGFVVDKTFTQQTTDNATRFAQIIPTKALFLPGGQAPAEGSLFKNPDLADTYRLLARRGVNALYRGPIADDIVAAVNRPPAEAGVLPVYPGSMTKADLRDYEALYQKPTKIDYRGLDVYGMAPSSSGGTTVGEALNILETESLRRMPRAEALHYYLDASALAFADRNKYVGDPAFVSVPTKKLLSQRFADNRACKILPTTALPAPAPAGDVNATGCTPATPLTSTDNGKSTTHLTTSDRWGNVVSYTLTIEQTGGSGIVVPGRGFILNNELTDFNYGPGTETAANRIQPGKRPRSSMSPTIVLRHGRPLLAVGSPGGSTIITTVLQTLVNRIDFGMSLPRAIAAPRASHRNNAVTGTTQPNLTAEQAFVDRYGPAMTAYGYAFAPIPAPGTSAADIGAVAALEFRRGGLVIAAAEPVRRGGGSAGVVYRVR